MATHRITANLTVEVTNPSTLAAIAGGGDERAAVEAALEAGLKELPAIAQRYGFRILDSSVSVTD